MIKTEENIETNSTNFYNFSTDYFSLESSPCVCAIDTITNEDGTIQEILKIKKKSEEVTCFAFGSKTGLCLTSPYGSIQEENVLSRLISVNQNDTRGLSDFFNQYGFLYPVSSKNFEQVDLSAINAVLARMKATVTLMSELNEPKQNIARITNAILYLLFSPQINFSFAGKNITCYPGVLPGLLKQADTLVDKNGAQEAFQKGTYTIIDTFANGKVNEIDADWYDAISSGTSVSKSADGEDDSTFRKIVRLYRNTVAEGSYNRYIIDFLFHYMTEVGIIKNVKMTNDGIVVSHYADLNGEYEKKYRSFIINAGKHLIADEINHCIRGICPYYNPVKMQPSWKARTLKDALYFSIFYMSPNSEIYRKCKNPSCDNRFLVSTTNSRKQYCCSECRNATAQRNHRKKVKQATKKEAIKN